MQAEVNSHHLRRARRSLLRAQALLRWRRLSSSGLPVVFGNAMPKSGSHLLLQILQGFSRIGPFAEAGGEPIRTITAGGRRRSPQEIRADLEALRPGDAVLGYLWASPENLEFLTRPGWATYLVLRDPRDMLVSHIHYATQMYPGHGMHDYYARLPGMDERLNVAIRGIREDGANMAGVAERYARWLGFLDRPEVLLLHFEDLISKREQKLDEMIDHLERAGFSPRLGREEAVQRLSDSIVPARSPTFRKGLSGEWREHFKEEHKALFQECAGDLLIRLGYEEDDSW
jgi:hypothetical protein